MIWEWQNIPCFGHVRRKHGKKGTHENEAHTVWGSIGPTVCTRMPAPHPPVELHNDSTTDASNTNHIDMHFTLPLAFIFVSAFESPSKIYLISEKRLAETETRNVAGLFGWCSGWDSRGGWGELIGYVFFVVDIFAKMDKQLRPSSWQQKKKRTTQIHRKFLFWNAKSLSQKAISTSVNHAMLTTELVFGFTLN